MEEDRPNDAQHIKEALQLRVDFKPPERRQGSAHIRGGRITSSSIHHRGKWMSRRMLQSGNALRKLIQIRCLAGCASKGF
jgi:hypothetical protein